MKLCRNLSLLLKRLEIDKNDFFEQLFSKSGFNQVFRELHVRKFRKISPDHFYDKNFQFYD